MRANMGANFWMGGGRKEGRGTLLGMLTLTLLGRKQLSIQWHSDSITQWLGISVIQWLGECIVNIQPTPWQHSVTRGMATYRVNWWILPAFVTRTYFTQQNGTHKTLFGLQAIWTQSHLGTTYLATVFFFLRWWPMESLWCLIVVPDYTAFSCPMPQTPYHTLYHS